MVSSLTGANSFRCPTLAQVCYGSMAWVLPGVLRNGTTKVPLLEVANETTSGAYKGNHAPAQAQVPSDTSLERMFTVPHSSRGPLFGAALLLWRDPGLSGRCCSAHYKRIPKLLPKDFKKSSGSAVGLWLRQRQGGDPKDTRLTSTSNAFSCPSRRTQRCVD